MAFFECLNYLPGKTDSLCHVDSGKSIGKTHQIGLLATDPGHDAAMSTGVLESIVCNCNSVDIAAVS